MTGKNEQENKQLILLDIDTSEMMEVSMDTAVVDHTVDAAFMTQQDSFDCIGIETLETKFGQRILCHTVIPGKSGTYSFTLGLPADNGKTGQERRKLLRLFDENPGLKLSRCKLVAVDTSYGQPAYLWRSVEQAATMRPATQQVQPRELPEVNLPD